MLQYLPIDNASCNKPRYQTYKRSRYSDCLQDRRTRVWIPAEARDCLFIKTIQTGPSPHKTIQTGPSPHKTSYKMGTDQGSFLGVKRPGREVDHSSSFSVEVMNEWSYNYTPIFNILASTGTIFPLPLTPCIIQCVPLATEPGISLLILTPMKILQEYVRWVRNEKECVCSVCL